ncbi:MAG: tetratricopeptide repeat protein [Burkholderiales bacterium]|nr:tetratricopeptide repeat protein [Burkholderiales bacterium]
MSFWEYLLGKRPKSEQLPIEPTIARSDSVKLEFAYAAICRGDFRQAREALDREPNTTNPNCAFLLLSAQTWRQLGAYEKGISECESALDLPSLTPSETSQVHMEIAQCKLAAADLQAAIDAIQVALAFDGSNGGAWLLLGDYKRRSDDHSAAQEAYRRATTMLESNQDTARAWFLLGQSMLYKGEIAAAKEAFETSLNLEPNLIDSHVGLGNVALWADDEQEAVRRFEYAFARMPNPGRLLSLNLGSAYQSCGRRDEAYQAFNRVLHEHPTDATARWYVCQLDLQLCRWEAGWRNYPSRFQAGATPYRPAVFKSWSGQIAKNDVLLVSSDEGLGDEIMYASCFADAATRVGHLVLECDPRLSALFRRSFPECTVVGTMREEHSRWLDGVRAPNWQIPSGQLPEIFRRSDSAFPFHHGYLKPDPHRTAIWKSLLTERLGQGLKVGISWRGGSVKTRMRARSLPAASWGEILSVPGVKFVNLQYGDYTQELAAINYLHGNCVHDFHLDNADYDDTAALVSALDLVVTVCTAVVHLAGALGQPVWILAPLSPGWRYTAERSTMPWYPSSRIFRQHTWGDWSAPCQELSAALAELTKNGTT